MPTTKAQTSLCIRAVWSAPLLSLSGTYNSLTSFMHKYNILVNLCSLADWFGAYMVRNPEDSFFASMPNYNSIPFCFSCSVGVILLCFLLLIIFFQKRYHITYTLYLSVPFKQYILPYTSLRQSYSKIRIILNHKMGKILNAYTQSKTLVLTKLKCTVYRLEVLWR